MEETEKLKQEVQNELNIIQEKLNRIIEVENINECSFFMVYKKDGKKLLKIDNITLNLN